MKILIRLSTVYCQNLKLPFWILMFSLLTGMPVFAQLPKAEVSDAEGPKPEEPNDGVIKKGTYLIGSYFNFTTTSTSKNKVRGIDTETSQIKLGGNFTAGKMLTDHWGFLINLGYVSTDNTTPQIVNGTLYNMEESRADFTIAPSLRYYKLVNEGTYIFIQGTIQASVGTLNSDEFDKNDNVVEYKYKTTGFGVGIGPGITYFMTKKLSTEIAIGVIGYQTLNGKDDLGNKTQTNTFQSLFYQNSVSLGFVYYFTPR